MRAHLQQSGLILAVALAASLAAVSAPRADEPAKPAAGFAPDIENGDAFRNNAILGLDSQTSFIRLANFRDEQVRDYIEVYSLDDEKTLGRFTVDVPAKASIQMNYLEVVSAAGLNYTDVAQKDLVLYLQNGRDKQLWQHVQYDANTRTLTDASACSVAPHVDYIPVSNVIINAHSSSIRTSVSLVTIHNFADIASAFDAKIYDARDGKLIGTVPLRLNARSSFNETVSWFEDWLNFTPASDQYHYNIELVPSSFPHARLVVGHAVANLATGAGANLSNPCAIHGGIITLDFPT